MTLHKNAIKKRRVPKEPMDRYNLFFSKIPKKLILDLYEYCKRDYEMFGYPEPRALSLHN